MAAEDAPRLSVLIPAHDEAAWIGACLDALLASTGALPAREVLVIANACRDDTVAQTQSRTEAARAAGWELRVIETPEPGKLRALNLGDGA
ncbi:MAG: glycosyltransferase, partial [Rhodobacteraceae bacterium]